jgi:hypothetical protein
MWLDAYFAIQVIRWTSRFISGDLSLVHDLVERHEAVNKGTRVLATVTTAGSDIDEEVHELLHQDNAIEQENQKLKVRIAQVLKDAETGEETLVEVKRELVKAKAAVKDLEDELLVKQERNDGLAESAEKLKVRIENAETGKETFKRELSKTKATSEALGQELLVEQERSDGLASDSRALRESAKEMNADLNRLEDERTELQNDNRSKKRRLSETQSTLDNTTHMGQVLYQHYLSNRCDLEQLATAEQLDGLDPLSVSDYPELGSKPTRYVALKNVTGRSCGREDRLLCDLNRDTFDSLGQNFTRWSLQHKPSRQQKFAALSFILDYDFDPDTYRTPFSSVTWRCLVYGVFKTKHTLRYSTWASLLDMLHLSARSNAWFTGRSFSLDFQLTQQKDLERVLGLSYHPALSMPAPQADIRHWLTNMSPEQALRIQHN